MAPGLKVRILELRASGKTYLEIAAAVGCSKSAVGIVVRDHERRKVLGL